MKAEFWVMRIVHTAIEIKKLGEPLIAIKYAKQLASGDLNYVNGELVEPIEVYEDQDTARSKAVEFTARTGFIAKVVMNADLD